MGTKKIILLAVAVAAAALAGYWYVTPQARPSWLGDRLPVADHAEVRLYRWRDASGQWQVSDQPPPDGVPYEIVSYRHDTNVLE